MVVVRFDAIDLQPAWVRSGTPARPGRPGWPTLTSLLARHAWTGEARRQQSSPPCL